MRFTKLLVLLSVVAIGAALFPKQTGAQVPPLPVDCQHTDTEFHSLRPYQASPCLSSLSESASFCGNNLTLKDTVTATYPGGGDCKIVNQKAQCTFNLNITTPVTIDLRGADLPIMGNTEEVINSQSSSESLDDAQKVNEYASWYLNGVTNRAEYLAEENQDKTADFSGPLKKLLPAQIQEASRIASIQAAGKTRHDQIVGCIEGGKVSECYPKTTNKLELRLSDWEDHTPPNRSDYGDFQDYWIKYKRWRGMRCLSLGISVCINDPLKPDYWGNLFPNIPFSSTEDLVGNVAIDKASPATNSKSTGVKVSGVTFSNQNPATLFFSHMQEVDELGNLLQDTFAQKGADKVGSPSDIASQSTCRETEVRSNKGDDLFAGQISGDLSYNVAFSCEFDNPTTTDGRICLGVGGHCVANSWGCGTSYGKLDCESGNKCGIGCSSTTQTCSKDVYINLSTTSKVPSADNVWSRLVAGPTAVFKRIYPKTNTAGSVGQIIDIPAATNVTFSGGSTGTSQTDLKLPHIGGVSEYFLKGIQTALRPKDYGEDVAFEPTNNSPVGNLGQCKYTPSQTISAMKKAAKKFGVSENLLQAIYEIEATDFIQNPGSYYCRENEATAAGPMQITRGTYNYLTCPEEKYEKDADKTGGICNSEGAKKSRCDVEDNFELAARTLLSKAGLQSDCNAKGPMPTDKMSIYKATCNYYGSFNPDILTINYAKEIPSGQRRADGEMNYCDIVCWKLGQCPPYPARQ